MVVFYLLVRSDCSCNLLAQLVALLTNLHVPAPARVCYLVSAGAVGINLTQASNVYLMEPCFNPALEAQAIGRVHRLGQKRAVTITHLVMEDSVETRIRSMLEKKYGSASATAVLDGVNNDVDDDEEEDDEDKKPAAKPSAATAAAPLIGSITTDKATVMEDEFDLLFGVDTAAAAPPVPDYASSSSNAAPL